MVELVEKNQTIFVPQYNIKRNLYKKIVWNENIVKRVQFQSLKRFIPVKNNPTMISIPFGFVDSSNSFVFD